MDFESDMLSAKLLQLCPTVCDPVDCSHQAPLSVGFSRQKYWSGLPCPPPGDLPNIGIRYLSLVSPALAGRFFATALSCVVNLGLKVLNESFQKQTTHKFYFVGHFV